METSYQLLILAVVAYFTVVSFNASQKNDFDTFVLRLNTSRGFCSTNRCRKFDGEEPPTWTISALEPYNNTSGASPVYCSNETVNATLELKSILTQLDRFWPSYTTENNIPLWQNVFRKYGTCAMLDKNASLTTPLQYFNKTLELYQHYNVSDWLSRANITQSNTKPVSLVNLTMAANKVFPGDVTFFCAGTRKENKSILVQVGLCFDTHYTPKKCNLSIPNGLQNCTELVWYLKSSSATALPGTLLLLASAIIALFMVKN